MKNSLGSPARGEAFYNRDKEIKNIYRALAASASIYLSAPRRVGKTSILMHLEEFPEYGYHFLYVITESVDNSDDFFKVIFEELIQSENVSRLTKLSNSAKELFANVLSKVKNIKGVEFREMENPDYYELLQELLLGLELGNSKLVIMVDEFPQTIQNILEKETSIAAQKFIQKNRELRHNKKLQNKISFIYTGSISLHPMVEKVTSLTAINDLKTIEVKPLSEKDAIIFIAKLLENDEIIIDESLLIYIITKVKWLIPFHLQLIVQEIIDVYETEEKEVTKESIDKAITQIIHTRNKPQFDPYFSRLQKLFKGKHYEFVLEVLQYVAEYDLIERNVLFDISIKYGVSDFQKLIIDTLEADGYLYFTEGSLRYTSPILQMWCKQHICK